MTTTGKLDHKLPRPTSQKSSHPKAVAKNLDGHRAGGKRSTVDLQADALLMLAELPNQVGSRQGMWRWATDQGWGVTRTWNCLRRVNALLHEHTKTESINAMGKILATIDAMLPLCRRPRLGTAHMVGTIIMKDDNDEVMYEIDHAAVARYLELIAKMLGLLKPDTPPGGPVYVVALPAAIPGETREDQLSTWAKQVQAEVRNETKEKP